MSASDADAVRHPYGRRVTMRLAATKVAEGLTVLVTFGAVQPRWSLAYIMDVALSASRKAAPKENNA